MSVGYGWPLLGSMAVALCESTRVPFPFESRASLYCFRLPNHLGLPLSSGRTIPRYPWSRFCTCGYDETGRLTAANTLLTARILLKVALMHAWIEAGSVASQTSPPP